MAMHRLYFILVAVHIVAVVVTGILWTILDLAPNQGCEQAFATFALCTLARST